MQATQPKKVIIIGDSNVGKTSILFRYVYNSFDDNSLPTLGAGFKTKDITWNDKIGVQQSVRIQIWDTAGQEKFDALTKMYFKNSDAAIIVYDVAHDLSFEKAQKWVKDLNEIEMSDQQKVLKFLVGNKIDMTDEKVISMAQGNEYARRIGATFFEVSAKENTGIIELFVSIGRQLKEMEVANAGKENFKGQNSVLEKSKAKKKGKCC